MKDAPRLKTKQKILISSLKLFNEKGASFVTTNYIAEKMEISPGNLYYHYRNKEEIIRSIWLEMTERMDVIWHGLMHCEPEEGMSDFFINVFDLFYNYRFFWIELSVLLSRDAILSDYYRKRGQEILTNYNLIMDTWVEKDIVKKEEFEADRKIILENTWFFGQFWVNSLYINNGNVTREDMQEGVLRVFRIIEPYLKEDPAKRIKSKIYNFYGVPS